jgi:putative tryptophan/tyrosine transport system substrate-binding protein
MNPFDVALFDELRGLRFVSGQNLKTDGHYSVRPERASAIATTMVAAGPDAILTGGDALTHAAQMATRAVSILGVGDDLVRSGFVRSFAHPGANTTGISILASELDVKRQDLLVELAPVARHIAALYDPGVAVPGHLRALADAARTRGIRLSVYRVSKAEEIVPAIDAAYAAGARALNVLASAFFNANQQLIRERAAMLKLPAIYHWPEIANAGGLAAYGPSFGGLGRQSARLLAKIFRGAKPSDLPVEQPDKFEFVINLKTAKALGLTVPPLLLVQATQVIE